MTTCLACLSAHVPTCPACLRAQVLTCLACLRAHVLRVLTWSRANAPCVLTCSSANVSCTLTGNLPCVCSRTESINRSFFHHFIFLFLYHSWYKQCLGNRKSLIVLSDYVRIFWFFSVTSGHKRNTKWL